MIGRRTLVIGSLALLPISAFAASPKQEIILPEPVYFRQYSSNQAMNVVSNTFMNRIQDKILFKGKDIIQISKRKPNTIRSELSDIWTFEAMQDGGPEHLEEEMIDNFSTKLVYNLAQLNNNNQKINYVRFGSNGVTINPYTFEPLLRFFLDHNV